MNTKVSTPKEPLPGAAETTELPKPVTKVKSAAKPPSKAANPEPTAADGANPAPAKGGKPAKEDKPQKIKMVRDSFTMPETDYAKIAELKKRCLQAGVHVKKSELLRAGLSSLSGMSDSALVKALKQVEIIKTGRPAKQG